MAENSGADGCDLSGDSREMRVLVVSKALISAAYREKLTHLARLGCDVYAVVPPHWQESGVQTFEGGEDGSYQVLVTPARWNGHFHLHYYPELARIVERLRPDVVHLDEEPYNVATFHGGRVSRRNGLPFLFFTWQNLNRRYPLPFSRMERWVYHAAAHAVAGSQAAASVLRCKGYPGPISVVPQFGVDEDDFSPGPVQARPFTVGFPNRLTPGKDPMLMLDALEMLPGEARLEVVGDGPLAGQLEREIVRRGLNGRVRVRARVPSADMPDVLRSMDVVVLPSRTTRRWKEQFGRVLVEAMACGVPVVGSASGEIPNIIGDAGLIVPEGNRGALAEAIRRVMCDHRLRSELATKGRLRALAHFTQRRVAEETYRAYRQAVGGAGS